MSNDRCYDEADLISYSSCELESEQAEQLESHLEICADCRRRLLVVLESGKQPSWLKSWNQSEVRKGWYEPPSDFGPNRLHADALGRDQGGLSGGRCPAIPLDLTAATIAAKRDATQPQVPPFQTPKSTGMESVTGDGELSASMTTQTESPANQGEISAKLQLDKSRSRLDSTISYPVNPGPSADEAGGDSLDWEPQPRRIEQFAIVRRIGGGGMGVVYEGRDTLTERRVALKLMQTAPPHKASLQRVINEAQALARLTHPQIVAMYEVVTYRDQPVLVLEFVEGCTLDTWQNHRLIKARLAATLVRDLALAVEHAHQRGVIHRDLKPSNVMLVGQSPVPEDISVKGATETPVKLSPKITDFGISRIVDQLTLTQTGELLGTPAYMAPELTSGATTQVGPATDIYGLGTILYELLTGRPLFTSVDPLVTLSLVRDADPISPRALRPDLPQDLNTICMKCLEKSPEQRFSSAQMLADELTAFLEDRPIVTRRVGPAQQLLRWCLRNRRLAMAMGFALFCLMAVVCTSLLFARHESQLRLEADQQTRRAQTAELKAARQADLATQMAQRLRESQERSLSKLDGLLFLIRGENVPDQAVRETTRELVTEMYVDYLRELGDPATWTLQHVRSALDFAWLLRDSEQAQAADEWLEKAHSVVERIDKQSGTDPDRLRLAAQLHQMQAHLAERRGDSLQAAELHRRTAQLQEQIISFLPENHEERQICSSMYANCARSLSLAGQLEQAVEQAKIAQYWQQSDVDLEPSDMNRQLLLVERIATLAWLQWRSGQQTEAERNLTAAEQLVTRIGREAPHTKNLANIQDRIKTFVAEMQSTRRHQDKVAPASNHPAA